MPILSNFPSGVPSSVTTELANKVDKVTGKGLSTNDYTTDEKTKLDGIEAGAQKNTVTSVAGKTGAVNLGAADVSAVGLTGDDTITGTKTFNGDVTLNSGITVKSNGNAVLNIEGVATNTDYIDVWVSGSTNKNRPLVLQTNEATTGNVGIGTATPSEKLEVNGNVKATKFNGDGSELTNVPYPVTSVAGKTGAVTLDKSNVGLGNVDNTSDADKPISTATQTALDKKQDAFPSTVSINADEIGLLTNAGGLAAGILRPQVRYSDSSYYNMFLSATYSGAEDTNYGFSAPMAEEEDPTQGQNPNEIYLSSMPFGRGIDFTTPISLKNVADPVDGTDAANKAYVDTKQHIFWATYGTTNVQEIGKAADAGNLVLCSYGGVLFQLINHQTNNDVTTFCEFLGMGNYIGIVVKYFRIFSDGDNDNWGSISSYDPLDHKTSLSLPVASWTGSDPYTQTVTISYATQQSKVDIQPSEELYTQLVADNVGYLAIKNVNGTFTAVAKGGKPSVDLNVQVTYNEVY